MKDYRDGETLIQVKSGERIEMRKDDGTCLRGRLFHTDSGVKLDLIGSWRAEHIHKTNLTNWVFRSI